MDNRMPRELMTAVPPRDLRSEFEAQLRAVGRVEAQLTKSGAGRERAEREVADVLRRELAAMLDNNKNIRDVLVELAAAIGHPAAS